MLFVRTVDYVLANLATEEEEEHTETMELDIDDSCIEHERCWDFDGKNGYYFDEYYPDKDALYDAAREQIDVPEGYELLELDLS